MIFWLTLLPSLVGVLALLISRPIRVEQWPPPPPLPTPEHDPARCPVCGGNPARGWDGADLGTVCGAEYGFGVRAREFHR